MTTTKQNHRIPTAWKGSTPTGGGGGGGGLMKTSFTGKSSSGVSSASSYSSECDSRMFGSGIPSLCRSGTSSRASSRSTSPSGCSNYSSSSSSIPRITRRHSLTEKNLHRVVQSSAATASPPRSAGAPQQNKTVMERLRLTKDKSKTPTASGQGNMAAAGSHGNSATEGRPGAKAPRKTLVYIDSSKIKHGSSPNLSQRQLLSTANNRGVTECQLEEQMRGSPGAGRRQQPAGKDSGHPDDAMTAHGDHPHRGAAAQVRKAAPDPAHGRLSKKERRSEDAPRHGSLLDVNDRKAGRKSSPCDKRAAASGGQTTGQAAADAAAHRTKGSKIASLVASKSSPPVGKTSSKTKQKVDAADTAAAREERGGATVSRKPSLKPMAAVKGTSKVSRDVQMTSSTHRSASNLSGKERPESSVMDVRQGEHVVAKPTPLPSHSIQPLSGTKAEQPSSPVHIAKVTPMSHMRAPPVSSREHAHEEVEHAVRADDQTSSQHHNKTREQSQREKPSSKTPHDAKRTVPKPASDQKQQEPTEVPSSGRNHQRADASMKLETTFDSSDQVITQTVRAADKPQLETNLSEESEDMSVNIKPMQPIVRSSPYAYMRSVGSLNTTKFPLSSLRYHTAQDASAKPRITASHHILSSNEVAKGHGVRQTESSGMLLTDGDFGPDLDVVDIAEGYMSDGGVLQGQGNIDDTLSGYVSESGAAYYSRRFQSRFKEGMAAVRESMQHDSDLGLEDDSFDDSSSASSDLDDTIEDMMMSADELQSTPRSYLSNNCGMNKLAGQLPVPSRKLAAPSGKGKEPSQNSAASGDQVRSLHMQRLPVADARGSSVPQSAGGGQPGQGRRLPAPTQNGTPSRLGPPHNKGAPPAVPPRTCSELKSSPKSSPKNKKKPPKGEESKLRSPREAAERVGHSPKGPHKEEVSHRDSQKTHSDGGAPRPAVTSAVTATMPGNPRTGRSMGSRLPGTTTQLANGHRLVDTTVVVGQRKGSASSARSIPAHTAAGVLSSSFDEATAPRCGGYENYSRAGQLSSGYMSGSSTLDRKHRMIPTVDTSQHPNRSASPALRSDGRYVPGAPIIPKTAVETVITNPMARYRGTSAQNSGLTMGTFIPGNLRPPSTPDRGRSTSPHQYLRCSRASSVPTRGGLVEGKSMESVAQPSGHGSIEAAIEHARNHSLSNARRLLNRRETTDTGDSARGTASERAFPVGRSTDREETHSERGYPSSPAQSAHCRVTAPPASGMLTGGPHCTQPSSTYHGHPRLSAPNYSGSGVGIPTSQHQTAEGQYGSNTGHYAPGMATRLSGTTSGRDGDAYVRFRAPQRNSYSFEVPRFSLRPGAFDLQDDETNIFGDLLDHGSSISLVSSSSSTFSAGDEQPPGEILKLRHELYTANDKVSLLTHQLQTQGHVVMAFEQSLSKMTSRLQGLSVSAENKDKELHDMRDTIEDLKQFQGVSDESLLSSRRRTSSQSDAMIGGGFTRHYSTGSMTSINSAASVSSTISQASEADAKGKQKKKKNWLRSSLHKIARGKKGRSNSPPDGNADVHSLSSQHSVTGMVVGGDRSSRLSQSSSTLFDPDDPEEVKDLKKQLRDKEMKLTDIRLEALTSAHQLDQLREQVGKMRDEMRHLRQENDSMQKALSASESGSLVSLHRSSAGSQLEQQFSLSDMASPHGSIDMLLNDTPDVPEGRRITISVYLGYHSNRSKQRPRGKHDETLIGAVYVSGKTKWDMLDTLVGRTYREYVVRVDPVSNLGLSADSIASYHIGDLTRYRDADVPELLPCGYLVGDDMQIRITLKGSEQCCVDSLAFETMIPKSLLQRYMSLLLEHRRIILCGPSGTGKSYLAQRLAESLVLRSGKSLTAGSVATFSVDHKSSKDLRQYLSNIADQCEGATAADLPSVIILDNLHHAGALSDVFNGLLNVKYHQCPYIIGTMSQTNCSTTNLQLHHNFRWVLCANHMEPVKGFLGRFLRRRLVETSVRTETHKEGMATVVDWIPQVWLHLNSFLESHSTSDITIGPRLFLSCPMDMEGSHVWFTDLWNYSIVPYLTEAIREAVQVYGAKGPWSDPMEWVGKTYPWPNTNQEPDWPSLLRLRQEDVGYECHHQVAESAKPAPSSDMNDNEGDVDADPLLNMLMRLQEAANYSSPQSNDSDSLSLDSHGSGTHDSDIITLESSL
ncbi:PREDICTED: neuron navigator 2-like isoform X2 [Priapulus caudatus]|uniref:Neuron navigator 2-like isoform X2 n=1 Tax=Priapulus caudatus TaxID=37621 RepID=A0ABM1E0M8_PRICU|nr:PREDICTED: neuron navigator 2-like isoform X2 [Priapulus caudatus]